MPLNLPLSLTCVTTKLEWLSHCNVAISDDLDAVFCAVLWSMYTHRVMQLGGDAALQLGAMFDPQLHGQGSVDKQHSSVPWLV